MNSIFTRRSIRKYTSQIVSQEDITYLLKAAMVAPSAGNQQPWQFVVVDDKNILEEISMKHPYAKMLLQAPVAIIVCGDISTQKHPGMWVQDCSAATQNILLAAESKNLGTCWLGLYPNEEMVNKIKELVKAPDNILPFSIISLGYKAEDKEPNNRYDEKRVHINQWSK